MLSSSDVEELLLLALNSKIKKRRWWMLQLFSQGFCTPGDLHRTRTRTPALFQLIFLVNSSAIPYCPLVKSASKIQMSAAHRDLDWSVTSARLLFDGDDAILRNTVRTPPTAGTNRCPPRQPGFCVAEPEDSHSLLEDIPVKSGRDRRKPTITSSKTAGIPNKIQKVSLNIRSVEINWNGSRFGINFIELQVY
jgi:hypothetical protein